MKSRTIDALTATTQELAITSQVLAISIEVVVVVGGACLYKKLKNELWSKDDPATEVIHLVPAEPEQKTTFKQKWNKVMKIAKAVIEG